MRARNSKRLVIDTDVAQASGDEDATDPRAINCRDFLKEVRSQDHRVVMTREISDEWKRHRSGFALEWRVSMDARRRIDRIKPPENKELRDKVTVTASDEDEIEAMQKDFHLLQAALATDQTVISLDETGRQLFKRASQQVGEIRNIIWVNPDRATEEQPITWLQNGAPPEPHRQLSA
ncbi:hypothetical protein F4009_17405 [Candidatus Poribacteria bacterium]|nr:hypothetical protein [Candidatus Poribacteria bacterium]MYH81195.1 hypothetical protein [Candidatus Poribacteria bacterium]MYK95743.1 hypothetical protein [Candidatus Poribacteria bacterium]